MSLVAAIRRMIEKGLTPEQALMAAEAIEETRPQKSTNAERQQRYRDRNALRNERNVTLRYAPPAAPNDAPVLTSNTENNLNPTTPLPPPPRKTNKINGCRKPDYPGEFEMLWAEFPKSANSSKLEGFRSWSRLGPDDQEQCFEGAMAYAAWLTAQARPPPPLHLATFINQRRFDTLLEAAE